jgi:23S rRNA (guanosine2251-2'-O)-methyltransferase
MCCALPLRLCAFAVIGLAVEGAGQLTEQRWLVGFHAVTARLRHQPDSVREVYVDARRRDPRLRDLTALAESCGVRVAAVDDARLAGLAGDARHQGVVARVEAAARPADLHDLLQGLSQPAFLLLLDGVTDPHNLGACLRVADAMGVHAVVVPKDRSVGLTPVVAKVASGAAESVPLIPVTNLVRTIEDLKAAGIWVLGAAGEGPESLLGARVEGPVAWVLGAEGTGLRRLTREHCDALVRIPMFGRVENLNVSVAAALCLYETRRQRELPAAPGKPRSRP